MTRRPDPAADAVAKAAARARKSKASVQEAIGTLLGDDAARDRGKADQRGDAEPR